MVQDVTIKDSYISGYFETGAVVGRNRGTISNCTNYSSITGNSLTGGIVGRNARITEKCENRGKVVGNMQTGGIAGNYDSNSNDAKLTSCVNYGTVKGDSNYTGGIVGGAFSSKAEVIIDNCKNYGEVSSDSTWCGGIAGRIMSNKIEKCSNYGNVYLTAVSTGYGVGGILGRGDSQVHDIYITECYNEGHVWLDNSQNLSTQVAGIVANADMGNNTEYKIHITNCYNKGEITCDIGDTTNSFNVSGIVSFARNAMISNCYNIGTLSAAGYSAFGGIANSAYDPVTFTNNYWLDICGAAYGVKSYQTANNGLNEGAESKTSDELKALASTLGDAYAQSDSINDGYPYLKNNKQK